MFYNVTLDEEIPHRLIFQAKIYNKNENEFNTIRIMIDTGCYNTMIPLQRAKTTGTPLGLTRPIVIGASVMEAEVYVIDSLRIGGADLHNIYMLAAPFRGELADTILMGLNVLNNWKYIIHRKGNIMEFEESYPDVIPNKAHPYRNYFDRQGKYVLLQDRNSQTS
jgi:hypothetical protein